MLIYGDAEYLFYHTYMIPRQSFGVHIKIVRIRSVSFLFENSKAHAKHRAHSREKLKEIIKSQCNGIDVMIQEDSKYHSS